MKKYAMGGMMRREREPMAERIRARRENGPARARPLPETEPMYKKGGSVKESKSMMKKEVAFMKKKGAPKSMLKHEMKEAGMKKMAAGGITLKPPKFQDEFPVHRRETRLAGGGSVGSFRKAADGVASKGKTKGKMVKMAYGGKC